MSALTFKHVETAHLQVLHTQRKEQEAFDAWKKHVDSRHPGTGAGDHEAFTAWIAEADRLEALYQAARATSHCELNTFASVVADHIDSENGR